MNSGQLQMLTLEGMVMTWRLIIEVGGGVAVLLAVIWLGLGYYLTRENNELHGIERLKEAVVLPIILGLGLLAVAFEPFRDAEGWD